jgi:HK97 family phage prohead protease
MTMKLLDADDFRSAAKDGEQQPEGTLFKFATTEPQQVGEDDARTERFVFSDATVDHSGDSIDPKGWKLDIFKRNPVALFSHMSWDPPIGRASNVKIQDGKLVGDIEFASADVYEFADTIYRLVKGKFLNAVSVGFKPDEWGFTSDKNRPFGIDFKKQTLLEISVCPVPCNPNALGEARSMGVNTAPLTEWAEKVLDSGDTVFLPRKDLEALRLQSKGAEPARYYIQGDSVLSAKGLERMRESFKRWHADPNELLILEPGYKLRAVEEEAAKAAPATETAEGLTVEIDTDELVKTVEALAEKAGRRVSAATKAKLQEAMDHHDAMGKCIKDVMCADDGSEDEPDGDFDDDPDELTPQPPGSVVVETVDSLTPEQRRLKEARELRASLTPND